MGEDPRKVWRGRAPALIVLEALLAGCAVEIGETKYELAEVEEDNPETLELYQHGTRQLNDGPIEPVLLRTEMTLRGFMRMARKATFDELAIISGNVALQRAAAEQAARRERAAARHNDRVQAQLMREMREKRP